MGQTDAIAKRHGAAPLANAKRERFCHEYLIDLNASQAASRTGYSARTAYSQGQRLLKDVEISARIDWLADERAKRMQLSADEVLRELAVLVRSDVRDFLVDDDGLLTLRDGADDAAWRAVSSVKHRITRRMVGETPEVEREIEFRLWDKNAAIGMVGKHLRLFVERHEVTGKDGTPLLPPGRLAPDEIRSRLAAIVGARN